MTWWWWARVEAAVVLQNQVDIVKDEALKVVVLDSLGVTDIHQLRAVENARTELLATFEKSVIYQTNEKRVQMWIFL